MIWRRTKPSTAEVEKPKGFDDFELRLGDVMRGERATLGKSLLDVQRELKIKATYIAAIENCDLSAFESQGFVAGYVRSYARYLGMDPELAFKRFCAESGFEVAHGMSAAASQAVVKAARAQSSGSDFREPLANPNALFVPRSESWLSRVEPGAVGSLLVLVALTGALGYGGWSVLREVQRVQLAPVDEAPLVVAEVDPLSNMQPLAPVGRVEPGAGQLAANDPAPQPGSPELLNRLRRPEALDVPVFVSRDGPIASIDPRQVGTYAGQGAVPVAGTAVMAAATETDLPGSDEIQVVAEAKPGVEVLAVRPSWVRVSSADGSVLFEKILDAGERYTVPAMEQAATLRSGNSGSVYFLVNGQAFGPAAPGPQVVKNVELTEESLKGKYAVANLDDDADLARIVNVAEVVTRPDQPQQ
ncbi:helix-turn-helix domain-containing protein [Gemmobacter serpentinus]|uniref:helix-turn-helix domain-containing protein n=1 Tax=Gemmobacter serpentinus TaxID=2652247 RepID=UPI00124E3897|nr:helix-turn-helix domain-containing protein [Gemmobacter serpentinus]